MTFSFMKMGKMADLQRTTALASKQVHRNWIPKYSKLRKDLSTGGCSLNKVHEVSVDVERISVKYNIIM